MRRIYLTVAALYVSIALIPLVIPGSLTIVSLLIASALTLYYLAEAFRRGRKGLSFKRGLTELSILMVIVPIALAVVVLYEGQAKFPGLLNSLLAFGLTLITWNYMLMSPLAVYHKYRELQEVERPLLYRPLVSVIVPARNEERTIAATIESILETDYEPKEVIVVDDASTDRTFEIASRYVSKKVKVLRREHGGRGKAPALNFGMRFAKGDVIVVVDADTLVGRRSITELVRKFQDPEVSAVSGNVLVRNRVNLLTKLQAIEYVLSFNFARRALDVFGAVMIISGSFGGFRREVLRSTGMYDTDVVTEDFDITIKALKTGRIVQASSLAVAFTEVPRKLRDLYRQ
ncbi:MAG: glycosyltransferase family 2 protein, partial [Candidatus Korarchaeota archaeon]|nr:glycosyltransferase family 2 protein [Candidatus Korarchaeota archaeon]